MFDTCNEKANCHAFFKVRFVANNWFEQVYRFVRHLHNTNKPPMLLCFRAQLHTANAPV